MPVMQEKPPVTTERDHISSRFTGLDTLRGFTLISMILYHICYNLAYIFHIPLPWYHTIGAHLWQLSICCTFLLLAGVCTHFTRRPVQRALRIGAAALTVTIVTYIFMPRELIVFGILHCMTWCLFSYAALEKLLRRVPQKFGLICSILLFFATFHVPQKYLLYQPFAIPLPQQWYLSYWLSIFGFISPDFFSADYFPIFPYIFLFFAGHFLGYQLYRLPKDIKDFSIRPLAFLGRHSLLVYLLHQPIVYGIMLFIFS